jgi:hypothetical protein
MDCSFSNNLQRPLCAHWKIDRRLIHVEDETLVAMRAKEEGTNQAHVIACLCLNFLWLALAKMCAHWIDKQMSFHKALGGAAPRNKVFLPNLVESFDATTTMAKVPILIPCLRFSKIYFSNAYLSGFNWLSGPG